MESDTAVEYTKSTFGTRATRIVILSFTKHPVELSLIYSLYCTKDWPVAITTDGCDALKSCESFVMAASAFKLTVGEVQNDLFVAGVIVA